MLARTAYLMQFLMAASIGLVFVFLADLQDEFGLSAFQTSVVAAAGFAVGLVSQLVLSPFVDRGHAGPMAWLSVVLAVVGSIGFGLSSEAWGFALSRGVTGIAFGLFGVVARKALLGLDIAGGGAKVGALLSAGVAGFISGPAIGAALGTISFAAPFIILGLVMVVPGVVAARQISSTEIAIAPVNYSDLGQLARRPRVQAAVITQIIVFGFIGIFDSTVDRYLTDLGMSTAVIAASLLIIGSPMLVLPRHAGAYAERVGGGRAVVPALALVVPVMVLYGFLNGAVMFVAVGITHAVTESFNLTAAQVLVLEAAGAERSAVGTGLLEAVGLGIAGLTALVGLPIYEAFGEAVLFGGWAALSAVGAGVVVLRLRAVTEPSLASGVTDPIAR